MNIEFEEPKVFIPKQEEPKGLVGYIIRLSDGKLNITMANVILIAIALLFFALSIIIPILLS